MSLCKTLKPGMYILCAIDLTGTLDIRFRSQGILDEILHPFLTFGVTLDSLHDEAVRRASQPAGERSDPCLELWGELNRGGISGHCEDACSVLPKYHLLSVMSSARLVAACPASLKRPEVAAQPRWVDFQTADIQTSSCERPLKAP